MLISRHVIHKTAFDGRAPEDSTGKDWEEKRMELKGRRKGRRIGERVGEGPKS